MAYKVYGFAENGRTNTVLAVAKAEGIDVELVVADPTNAESRASYTAKFPNSEGRIPGLEGPNIHLTECVAICSYLAGLKNKAKLLGNSKEDAAEILQWMSFTNNHIMTPIGEWFTPLKPNSPVPYNKPAVQAAEKKTLASLTTLEHALLTRTFLVGHRFSLADIFAAFMVGRGCQLVLDASWRAAHPNIMRHYETVIHQKIITDFTSKPVFIEKKPEYVAPKKESKAAPAAAAAPKAEKKPAKKDDDDDDEPSVPAEPKAKHPCEALGSAKCFPFDEWKRQYSNSDFPKAMEWLTSNLDESEYTFWRVAYKYDDELTQVFMSGNLLTGLHTRLEGSRKYLFGSSGVYGTANNSKIQGAYMIRGSDYKGVFEVAPDWESYNFEKLDFKKDIDYIKGCWNWDNSYDGLPYADGKVFK